MKKSKHKNGKLVNKPKCECGAVMVDAGSGIGYYCPKMCKFSRLSFEDYDKMMMKSKEEEMKKYIKYMQEMKDSLENKNNVDLLF